MNRCLAKFGVYPSTTYGADGKLRFHSDNPVTLMDGDKNIAKSYYFTWEAIAIGNPKVSHFVWFWHLQNDSGNVKIGVEHFMDSICTRHILCVLFRQCYYVLSIYRLGRCKFRDYAVEYSLRFPKSIQIAKEMSEL